ncbi:MAG: hypothetical protein ACLQVG_05690 [Terriglobia bacterium]
MSPSVLLESWGPPVGLIVAAFVLVGAVAGTVGGGIAFARARELLRQRLVLGALAGALTSSVMIPAFMNPFTRFVLCCLVGGDAVADGLSILLKAIGRRK